MQKTTSGRPGALSALMRQRCPRCRRGIVFSSGTTMNRRCPRCGFNFEREPGFFSGAIYLGILLATPIVLAILCGLLLLFPSVPLQIPALVAVLFYVPLLPLTVRLSRILWMNIGSGFSPTDHGDEHRPPPARPLVPPEPDMPGTSADPDAGDPYQGRGLSR